MWTIDIKKSRARPPYAVRERLRQIIPRITGRSTTVHRGRGQKLFEEVQAPVWERYADQGKIRYALNASHPLAEAVVRRLDEPGEKSFGLLLEVIAAALPVEMIYSDYSTNPRDVRQISDGPEIADRLRTVKCALFGEGAADPDVLREVIRSTRLFDNHKDVVEQFIREECQ